MNRQVWGRYAMAAKCRQSDGFAVSPKQHKFSDIASKKHL